MAELATEGPSRHCHVLCPLPCRLFEMGFAEQLQEIIARLPDCHQTVLFSATLPKLLVEFARAGEGTDSDWGEPGDRDMTRSHSWARPNQAGSSRSPSQVVGLVVVAHPTGSPCATCHHVPQVSLSQC